MNVSRQTSAVRKLYPLLPDEMFFFATKEVEDVNLEVGNVITLNSCGDKRIQDALLHQTKLWVNSKK